MRGRSPIIAWKITLLIPRQVAKQELSILRRTTPFDLTYWNIRDPPPGANEREAKKWRRLYQYDIVCLLPDPWRFGR